MGEGKVQAGQMVPPKLHSLGGTIANQHTHFSPEDMMAPLEVNIEAAFQADADLEMVQELGAPAPAPGAAPDVVTTAWKALLIHPKMACLFVKGLPVHEVFQLAHAVSGVIPPPLQGDLTPFMDFLHCAVVEGAVGTSTLAGDWGPLVHMSSEVLENWCHELVSYFADRVPEQIPAPPAPAPAGGGTPPVVIVQPPHENVPKPHATFEQNKLFTVTGVERPWNALTDDSLCLHW